MCEYVKQRKPFLSQQHHQQQALIGIILCLPLHLPMCFHVLFPSVCFSLRFLSVDAIMVANKSFPLFCHAGVTHLTGRTPHQDGQHSDHK